jgi:hypothetical protein
MKHSVLDVVVLEKDLPARGLKHGDLGTIVEVYEQGAFEVEFTTAAGRTQALLTLTDADVRAAGDNDIPSARPHCRV